MTDIEKLELLKSALLVAVADGKLKHSEMGVVMGLAARVGVGRASLEAMIDAANDGRMGHDDILMRSSRSARTALELLVAQARIDGEITDAEREVLVLIGSRFNITGEEFQKIYQAGIARADKIRKSR
ncbi:MAG: hypothetical protein ACYTF1_18940 [Planctomycetota bacterium]|jgi:tellurite resistance protein